MAIESDEFNARMADIAMQTGFQLLGFGHSCAVARMSRRPGCATPASRQAIAAMEAYKFAEFSYDPAADTWERADGAGRVPLRHAAQQHRDAAMRYFDAAIQCLDAAAAFLGREDMAARWRVWYADAYPDAAPARIQIDGRALEKYDLDRAIADEQIARAEEAH